MQADDGEVVEGGKLLKVKLTLWLQSCLMSLREQSEAEDSSSSESSSDSDNERE